MSAFRSTDKPPRPPQEAAADSTVSDACRAKPVGNITEFAECLVKGHDDCRHGLRFGESRFCWHPRRQEIIARTASLT
ncbi:MAG TPA: hypothetical protein VMU04_25985 [Candidatus Acidoferrum sp.]|nr:hypothetical protein [Candidatus Acidoferrum sp.]